jgi:hypothetical protein
MPKEKLRCKLDEKRQRQRYKDKEGKRVRKKKIS